MPKTPMWISLSLCVVGLVGYAVYWSASSSKKSSETAILKADADAGASVGDVAIDSSPNALIGGVSRPKADVRDRGTPKAKYDPNRPVPLKPEGGTPKVALDANEQVAQAAEAIRTGEHPERYSSLVVPHNFDSEAFESDPASYAKQYAAIVEPGRVFAPAQPAEGVSALRSHGERFHRVVQGETVRLIAAAKANAPVTFTSFGFGQFENKLTSITVVADKEGLAVAPFTATSGTKNNINVLAASPVMAEQVKFVVSVKLP